MSHIAAPALQKGEAVSDYMERTLAEPENRQLDPELCNLIQAYALLRIVQGVSGRAVYSSQPVQRVDEVFVPTSIEVARNHNAEGRRLAATLRENTNAADGRKDVESKAGEEFDATWTTLELQPEFAQKLGNALTAIEFDWQDHEIEVLKKVGIDEDPEAHASLLSSMVQRLRGTQTRRTGLVFPLDALADSLQEIFFERGISVPHLTQIIDNAVKSYYSVSSPQS